MARTLEEFKQQMGNEPKRVSNKKTETLSEFKARTAGVNIKTETPKTTDAGKQPASKSYTSKRMEDMGINNNNADNSVNGVTRTLTAAAAAVPRYGASIMEDLRMGNEFATTYQPNGGSISDYALEQYNQGKLTGASKDAVEKYLGNQQITKDSVKKYADLSDSMTRAGEATLNESMRGLDTTTAKGKLASQALQAVSSATENLLDAGVGGAIGLGGAWNYIPFAARSFGMSAQEARNSGADLSTQLDYALAQTAKEIGTEMMWGAGNIYGKGALDDLAEGGIKKLIRNSSMNGAMKNVVATAAQLGLDFTTEGLEEVVGDLIEGYFIRQMIDPNAAPPTGEDLWNSFVVGGMSGAMMGTGNLLSQSMNARVNNTQGRAEQILRDALNTESYDAQMLARDMQGKSYLTSDLQELENLTAQDRFRTMQESYDKQAEESRKVSPETMQELLRQGTAYGSQTAQANAGSENVAKADLAQIARDITTAQNKVAQSDLVRDAFSQVSTENGQVTNKTAEAILESPQTMEYLGIKVDDSMPISQQVRTVRESVKELASRNAERIKAVNDNIQSQKKRAEIADFTNNLNLGETGSKVINDIAKTAPNIGEQLEKVKAATVYYNAGANGTDLNSVKVSNDVLTDEEKTNMYKAGMSDGQNSSGNGKRQNNLGKSGRSEKDAQRRRITEREHRRTQRQIQRNTVRSAAKGEEVVSAQDIGYANGSTDKSLRVLPKSSYDVLDKESQKKVKNLEDKGYEVILVTSAYENDKGGLLTEINGRISRGAISGNKIYITADHWNLSVAQIADHEFFHSVLNNNNGLRERLWDQLNDKFSATEMLALQMAYANDYRWTDKSIEYIQDEILCDAFAGIDIFEDKDIFRLHVDNYTELVRELTSEESAKGYTERGPDRTQFSTENREPIVGEANDMVIPKQLKGKTKYSEETYRNVYGKKATKIIKGGYEMYDVAPKSGRQVLIDAIRKFNSPAAAKRIEADVIKKLDDMAKFMKDRELKYHFIGLNDINNAKIILREEISDDGTRIQKVVLSAMVKNGAYPVNFDFTKVCERRIPMTNFIKELANRPGRKNGDTMLSEISLSQANLFKMNKILLENGYDTACLGCFVESRRYNIEKWAKKFILLYNNAVKEINPKAGYFNFAKYKAESIKNISTEEIEGLMQDAEAYERNKKNANQVKRETTGGNLNTEEKIRQFVKGKNSQKLLRVEDLITEDGRTNLHREYPQLESLVLGNYGSNTPKSMEVFTPYNGEIELIDDNVPGFENLNEYIKHIAGVRSQSFSDFIITHVFDVMQKTAAMTARGLVAHTYTKVPSRAVLFGKTNEKINMSIMFNIDRKNPWWDAGLDSNGNYIIGDRESADRYEAETGEKMWVQSFPFELAKQIQRTPGYAGNVGTIGVGYSYNAMVKMFNDDDIRFIIGYHSSGLPAQIKKATNIELAADYQATQGTNRIVGFRKVTNYQNVPIPTYATWAAKQKKSELYTGKDAERFMDLQALYNEKVNSGMSSAEAGKSVLKDLLDFCEQNHLTIVTTQDEHYHGSYNIYEDLEKTQEPRATADNFISWCIGEKGVLPINYEFALLENYYKILYDFEVYNPITGEYAPQLPVKMEFPENFEQLVDGYMQEYDDKLRGYTENFEPTLEALYEAMQPGKKKSAKTTNYSEESDSTGRSLTEAQVRYFKNSKIRDKNGILIPMYHGSENAGFTVFNSEYGISSRFFFFTDSLDAAKGYSGTHDLFKVKDYSSIGELENYIDDAGYGDDYSVRKNGSEYELLDDRGNVEATGSLSDLQIAFDSLSGWGGGDASNYEVYLNITNPLVIDGKGNNWDEIPVPWQNETMTTNAIAEYAYENGYDGIKVTNIFDIGLYNSSREYKPTNVVVAFEPNQIKLTSNLNPTDDADIRYSEEVTDDNTLKFLNDQINSGDYIVTYKSMRLDNGELHSPMAALINGKYENAYELGKWYQAVEHPELIKIDKNNGRPYFDLKKGKGANNKSLGTVPARYNPYEHSSNSVFNDQFKTAYKRPELVTVEMWIPKSELTSGYQAQYAKDPVGWTEWKSGEISNALAKAGKPRRDLMLSRWAMPHRILTNRETAEKLIDFIDGTDIKINAELVTPGVLGELAKLGANIEYTKIVPAPNYSEENLAADENRRLQAEVKKLQAKLALTKEQRDYWKRETTLSPKEAVNHTDVLRVAKDFIKKWDGTINASEISSDMQKLTELIYEGKLMDEILPPALDIAEKICDSARVITNDESYRNYLEIKKYFRTTPIKWVEGIGDPGFYKRNFGKIKFSNDERKVTVDAMWDEWQSRWGEEFFPSEVTTSQDKAEHIASIIDSLESLYENPYDSDFADAVEACANNLIFDIVNGGIRYTPIGNPTRADIAQAKYNKAIAEKNREIEEMRIANEDIAKQLNSEIRRLLAEADRTAQAHASEIAGYEANYTPNEIVENIVRDLWAKHSELTKTQIEMAAMQEFYRGREQKAQEKLKAVRQDRDEKLEALKQHYRDVVQRRRLRKAESEARQKLLKIARRLQNKKLPQVSRALLNQYIENLDTISVSITGAKLEKLADLQAAYLLQAENDPNFIKDPNIEKAIARLGQKRISELSIDEVVTLTNILLNIEKEIRDANKLIGIEDRRDVAEQAMETISNIKYSKGTKDNVKDWLVTSTLSPVRLIRRMTGYAENDPLYNAVNNLADGQRKMFDYQRRAYDMFKKWTTDKEYIRSLQEVMTISGWKDSKKVDVAITKDMAIALYMHSLNDQNLAHINDGGVTIPDIDVLKKNPANAYGQGSTRIRLTPSDVRGIIASLNEKDIAYAKAARTYFDSISTKEINEVSEALVGYSLAQVENYFPINTDSSFTRKDFDSIKMDGTIEGMGFLKERVNAKNPIYLRGFTDVLNKSIDMNSKYIGLAIPVRNFNKLWNATLSNGISGSYYDSSVKEAVNSKWGKRGTDYIEKMMADLQNPSRRQDELDGWLAKIRSNYAGAVLTLNMSVAMKQAASYPTAAAVLGWKPLAKAMGRFGKVDLDLINKYTPLQWYRSQGFADTELGDLKSRNKQIPKLLNWIQAADLATTRKLWKASEIYVEDNTKLTKGSDEFYKAVADIYNRVIEETQPNYTTMQRPQILRTDSSLVSTLVMFKTQPFQNFNVLYDAVGEYEALSRAKKNGAKVDLTQASKNVTNAFTSQLVSLSVFAGMTMLWNMIRRRDEDYEDEQGKKTFLSVFKKLAADMISGATGMVPFGSNVYDQLKSMFTDAKNYGFSSVTITALNDAMTSISDMTHDIQDAIETARKGDKYDWRKFTVKNEDRLENIAKLFGVPLENVVNLFRAGYNWASVIEYGEYYGEYKSLMVTYLPTSSNAKSKYYNLLYKAKGTPEYNKIRNDMIKSGYFTEKSIADAMKKRSK